MATPTPACSRFQLGTYCAALNWFLYKSASDPAAIYGVGLVEKITAIISVSMQYEVINGLKIDDSPTGAVGINKPGLFSFGIAAGF
jgi:hypothetical protein